MVAVLPFRVTAVGIVAVVGALFVSAMTILSPGVAEPFIWIVALSTVPPVTAAVPKVMAVGDGGTMVTVAVATLVGTVLSCSELETVTVLVTAVRVTRVGMLTTI